MDKIDSLDKINAFVSDIRSLRKGYLTNFFLDRKKHSLWIEKGELFYVSFPDCYFLLHLTNSVNNLFFITTTSQQLAENLKAFLPIFAEQMVVDIVGDAKIVDLKDVFVEQLQAFSDVDRDPRGRTITVAYYALVNPVGMNVAGYDDAADARWFALSDMPSLAFDHEHVLQVALHRLALKVYLQLNGIEKLDEHFKGFDLKRLQNLIPNKL